MLKLYIGKKEVKITKFTFPGGETSISISDEANRGVVGMYGRVVLNFESNRDLFDLALLKNAIEAYYWHKIDLSLDMPYVPYGRQDRICNAGEALSVKVLANFINALEFSRVYTMDNHSDVATALLNNCINIDLNKCAANIPLSCEVVLVSPDAGANKKVYSFAKECVFNKVVRADKSRDMETGKITGTTVYWSYDLPKDVNVCIIDDICDGGYTFVRLAQELKSKTTGKICLYVTHGIFSKGLVPFKDLIDVVYVKNLFPQHTKESLEREVHGMVTLEII